ncbi:MAG: hypothetical protein ACLU5F_01830 [Anaerovoracaceae bacterium]
MKKSLLNRAVKNKFEVCFLQRNIGKKQKNKKIIHIASNSSIAVFPVGLQRETGRKTGF